MKLTMALPTWSHHALPEINTVCLYIYTIADTTGYVYMHGGVNVVILVLCLLFKKCHNPE